MFMIHVSHVTFKSRCLVEDTTATIKTTALPLLMTRNEMFKKKKTGSYVDKNGPTH